MFWPNFPDNVSYSKKSLNQEIDLLNDIMTYMKIKDGKHFFSNTFSYFICLQNRRHSDKMKMWEDEINSINMKKNDQKLPEKVWRPLGTA